MSRTLQFTIEGDVDVIVFVEEGDFDGDGFTDLKFTVTVDESGGNIADLRGLFWDVSDESKLSGMQTYAPESPDITDSQFAANSVKDLGNGANMKGAITNKGKGFDAGVEIGTQGAGKDDIQSTMFVITSPGEDLTLDDIGGMRFGARLTSVGLDGGDREGSLKLAAIAPHAPDAIDDAFSGDEDTVIITGNVLDNDTDDDGDILMVTDFQITSPGIEELVVNADGSYSLEPVTSFTGDVTFEYTVSDGNGGTDWAEVTVTINEVAGITVDLGEVPLDIVLAFDLSASFGDDLLNIQGSPGFFSTLDGALDPTDAGLVKFGVTSYIDYPFSPFGGAGDFIYSVNQDLTATDASVQAALDGMATGSGGDGPEAQLVSLQQVGLGNGLTYTAGSERFIVLSTDALFHLAGDFLAGGVNDNDTDLTDGSGPGGEEDYPTIANVAAALAGNGLTPIFAIAGGAGLEASYQALLDALNVIDPTIGGAVVELAADSSNLAAAIEAGLFQDLDGTDGRDILSGNSLRNTINGFDRADIINGEGGDDVLIGGNGNDTVTGGEGADTFVFQNDPLFRGTDTVTDYVDGTDMLRLEGYGALTFAGLTIADDGFGNAEISVGDGEDDPIAILTGVATASLDAGDFTFIA